MISYPADRKNIGFAIRFVKAVMASDAILVHGADVVAFVTWIVSIEDRLHYTQAVRLWREDIMSKFGIQRNQKHSQLVKDSLESGLVHRVERTQGSRKQMEFWVTVPHWLVPYMQYPSGSENGTSDHASGSINGTSSQAMGSKNGTSDGTSGGTLSIPLPHNPREKRQKFIAPTLEQVRVYCASRTSNVDPEQFIDYYTSNGWIVGKSPMRDWQAAVRTWERNETKGRKATTTESRPELRDIRRAGA